MSEWRREQKYTNLDRLFFKGWRGILLGAPFKGGPGKILVRHPPTGKKERGLNAASLSFSDS
ncbi:hypothetical protein B4135_1034 [Caldibacillus debilis]|uniref:Uncharacterized protein n=1 Tax=Caldibacillus debilis TaxID=301148 RepID=A0A150MEN3_9BACI|nr:hypothetical protein B4135_1034 [Caldibacillus debilis]